MKENALSGKRALHSPLVEPGIGVGLAVVVDVAGTAIGAEQGIDIEVGAEEVVDVWVERDAVAGTEVENVDVADMGVERVELKPGTEVGYAGVERAQVAALALVLQALYKPGKCGSTTVNIAVHSSMGSHMLDICSYFSSP